MSITVSILAVWISFNVAVAVALTLRNPVRRKPVLQPRAFRLVARAESYKPL